MITSDNYFFVHKWTILEVWAKLKCSNINLRILILIRANEILEFKFNITTQNFRIENGLVDEGKIYFTYMVMSEYCTIGRFH